MVGSDLLSGLGRVIGRAIEARAARGVLMGKLLQIIEAVQELVASIRELVREVKDLRDDIGAIVEAAKLLKR